jgi:hypothetical protein
MHTRFDDVCAAALPADALASLAALRCEPGLQVATAYGRLWLRFEPGSERVLRGILPLYGVALFTFRDGAWRHFGQSLPAFDFPHGMRFESLYQLLFPAAVLPVPAAAAPIQPVRLTLAPDDRPRPTTAMVCSMPALAAWADTVPSARLRRLHAVMRGGRILVLGQMLPLLAGATRFWGKLVLVSLGSRPEPDLPESALREAAGVEADELLLLGQERVDAVPRAALATLSRAALRCLSRDRQGAEKAHPAP